VRRVEANCDLDYEPVLDEDRVPNATDTFANAAKPDFYTLHQSRYCFLAATLRFSDDEDEGVCCQVYRQSLQADLPVHGKNARACFGCLVVRWNADEAGRVRGIFPDLVAEFSW